MASKGDTGRSKRPSGKADSGKGDSSSLRKRDSGAQKSPKKTTSARKSARVDDEGDGDDDDAPKSKRRGSARNPAAEGGPKGDAGKGKRMFLIATPFTILLLLGFGAYLYSLPEPKEAVVTVIDPNVDAKLAGDKFLQAKTLYESGHNTEGPAGTAKVKQAQKLLQEASELLEKAREKSDKNGDGASGVNSSGKVEYNAFEDLDPKIGTLLNLVRKELLMRE